MPLKQPVYSKRYDIYAQESIPLSFNFSIVIFNQQIAGKKIKRKTIKNKKKTEQKKKLYHNRIIDAKT